MMFRKKPVVIEAVQWDGKESTLNDLIKAGMQPAAFLKSKFHSEEVRNLEIFTLEGFMRASSGDWIIKGVNGEFYPCKPDIFEKTYEAVE